MNRKDFELVARGLRAARPPACDGFERTGWAEMVEVLADTIGKADGCHGFDRVKFLKACGHAE